MPHAIPHPPKGGACSDLCQCIRRDAHHLQDIGLLKFVQAHCARGGLTKLDKANHPVKHLLQVYKNCGSLVKVTTKSWFREHISAALSCGGYELCLESISFLNEECSNMIIKCQRVVPPEEAAKDIPGMHIPRGALSHNTTNMTGLSLTTSGQ